LGAIFSPHEAVALLHINLAKGGFVVVCKGFLQEMQDARMRVGFWGVTRTGDDKCVQASVQHEEYIVPVDQVLRLLFYTAESCVLGEETYLQVFFGDLATTIPQAQGFSCF
jgi:hypothetical protein